MLTFLLSVLGLVALQLPVGKTQTLPAPDGFVNIYALPVGQGDATIIQCPNTAGKKISIVDIGSSKSTGFDKTDVVKYLDLTKNDVEAVVLTHPDKDHVNYLDAVLAKIPLAKYPDVYHSCYWKDYQGYVTDPNVKTYQIKQCCGWTGCNQAIDICGKTVSINFIGSEQNGCSATQAGTNGDSIVALIGYSVTDVLLAGDFEGNAGFINNFLACTGGTGAGSDLRSELFRLSHHGADNGLANTPNFLTAVGPARYVFSSSGLHSGYGHPRCTFKNYYTGIANNVPLHAYTCYTAPGAMDKTPTTTGIYVTTVEDAAGNPDNYVIKFRISSAGAITPSLISV